MELYYGYCCPAHLERPVPGLAEVHHAAALGDRALDPQEDSDGSGLAGQQPAQLSLVAWVDELCQLQSQQVRLAQPEESRDILADMDDVTSGAEQERKPVQAGERLQLRQHLVLNCGQLQPWLGIIQSPTHIHTNFTFTFIEYIEKFEVSYTQSND